MQLFTTTVTSVSAHTRVGPLAQTTFRNVAASLVRVATAQPSAGPAEKAAVKHPTLSLAGCLREYILSSRGRSHDLVVLPEQECGLMLVVRLSAELYKVFVNIKKSVRMLNFIFESTVY